MTRFTIFTLQQIWESSNQGRWDRRDM